MGQMVDKYSKLLDPRPLLANTVQTDGTINDQSKPKSTKCNVILSFTIRTYGQLF